jgi:translocation and assembly module TamA
LGFVRVVSRIGALALVIASASPAFAFDIFGIKLFEDARQQDAAAVLSDPQPYKLDFSTSGATGDLDAAIRNGSDLWAGKDSPASGTAGLLAKATGDYRRITAALYTQGYYGGTVNISIGGREASTVAPDANLPDPVPVRVVVQPGPLFHFRRLQIANRAPPASTPGDQVPSLADQGFATGQIARSSSVLKAEQIELDAWRQQGYAKAKVAGQDVVADHASNTVDVTIRMDPGRKAAVGPVAVSGTQNMDPAFVARQTGLVPGKEYDPDDVAQADKRLMRLEVFRSERIAEADFIGSNGLLPFNVTVQELPLHRFGVGATFSTVDGLGTEGYWLQRNLFGQAESLRIDANVSGIALPIDAAKFNYALGATFKKPGILTPDTDLLANIAAAREVVPTYTETSASAKLGLNHTLTDQLSFEGDLEAQRSYFEDSFGARNFALAGVFGSVTHDSRDKPTDAAHGFYANATLEPFYEFYFGNPQLRATAEARAYFGFGDHDKFVLAGRLKAGALLGPSLDEIPPDKLFFAGGGGSVRGYGFKSIGVDGPGGTVTGGRYLLEASAEGRMRINDSFGAVAFVDGGYVAADTFPGLADLRVGAGVGLRYYTGLGPLRLDFAVPLNKRAGDPDYALYLGLGQAF